MSSFHQKLFLILIIIYADEIRFFLSPFSWFIGLIVIGILLIYSYAILVLAWENELGRKVICSILYSIPVIFSLILYILGTQDYAFVILFAYVFILLISKRKALIEKIKKNKIENDNLKQTKQDLKYIDSLKKITKKDIAKMLNKK